jgi:hypothetical protein
MRSVNIIRGRNRNLNKDSHGVEMTTWIELMNPFNPELALDTPSNKWVKKSFTRMLPAGRGSVSRHPPNGAVGLTDTDRQRTSQGESFLPGPGHTSEYFDARGYNLDNHRTVR